MKTFYHVSSAYLGDVFSFTPKVPETISKGFNEDASTKRVCVSPTIGQCLMGKSGVKTVGSALEDIMQPEYFVYEIQTKNALPATTVHDYSITHEHWLLGEEEFRMIRTIKRGTKEL